jgi:hypothetical protein
LQTVAPQGKPAFLSKAVIVYHNKALQHKSILPGSSAKNRDAFRPTCRADSVPIPGVFMVDGRLPFVVYATIIHINQKYLTVIYSCIYNNQPTNNTFVYFSNKSISSTSPLFNPYHFTMC